MSDDQQERIRQKKEAERAQMGEDAAAARTRLQTMPLQAARFKEGVLVPALQQVQGELAPEKFIELKGFRVTSRGPVYMRGDAHVIDRQVGRTARPELTFDFTISPSREDPDVLWLRTTWKAGATRAVPLESLCGPLEDFTTESIAHEVNETWLAA